MLEKVGNNDILVRNYSSVFDIKEYIQDELIPKAFPDIPMEKLNLGFTGVISEYLAQVVEDAHGTASLMMNESFINKAVLPDSIYGHASIFGLGYTFAVPSRCNFALQLNMSQVIQFSEPVQGTTTMRYILDKDTRLILGEFSYKLDYDVYIDHQFINNQRVFNIYYNIEETNSISKIKNQYIKHQATSIDWLILFVELQEFERKTDDEAITDNLLTAGSDINIRWTNQIAGLDVIYITPTGQRMPMKLKTQYTRAEAEPFAWYRFTEDNAIALSFSNSAASWSPDFNSKIEYTVYTTSGSSANFTAYDRRTGVPVAKTGERYSYNNQTLMTALCYSGSQGGMDKGTIEDLRDDIVLAYNTVNVLTTDHDLQLWFERYGKRYGTHAKFFKRRDDPSGTLFAEFIAIKDGTYLYPTNTLSIRVNQSDFDYVNSDANGQNQEFIIKPGHLWEYDDQDGSVERHQVRMVKSLGGNAMITDDVIPEITDERPFIFVNPFFIKINRTPTVIMNYNYLLDHTSFPEDEPIQTDCFYQFQLASFSIERTLSPKHNNMYHIEVICVPVITTDKTMVYINGVGPDFPVKDNNLRLILIMRTAEDGETGYVEMAPTEIRQGGGIVFAIDIAVYDNISSDLLLEIDQERTPGVKSLIASGPKAGKVFVDSAEASFHFAVMMKDGLHDANRFYDDPAFDGYVMANRFRNNYRDLTLYKPMSMMRSMITFEGTNDDYTVTASLIPFLRYDIPLDEEKMTYFIQAFDAQYVAMEPVLNMLNGNSYLDFKLYNTYGRSNNYYIGPEDNVPVLKNSTILLDNLHVKVRLVISVYDRSLYSQTVREVQNEVMKTFDALSSENNQDLYVSTMIQNIMDNHPNVRYLRFLGFNKYDANKQSIFIKFKDITYLTEDQIMSIVPEIIRADESSIEVTEET